MCIYLPKEGDMSVLSEYKGRNNKCLLACLPTNLNQFKKKKTYKGRAIIWFLSKRACFYICV